MSAVFPTLDCQFIALSKSNLWTFTVNEKLQKGALNHMAAWLLMMSTKKGREKDKTTKRNGKSLWHGEPFGHSEPMLKTM